ncbi:MAG: hypothetical protein V1875_06330 [Candidatus Altiarchaeota archaeon]
MIRREDRFNSFMHLVFRLGWLVALMGILVYFAGFFAAYADLTLDYAGIWTAFNSLPFWLQLIVVGIILVLTAMIVGASREVVEAMVDHLFGKDQEAF